MKNLLWALALVFFVDCNTVIAQNITDKLVVAVVDSKLPSVLYEHSDKRWEMGIYSLSINKSGATRFSSTDAHLIFIQPIEAIISGKINKNIFGAQITLGCNSRVITDSKVKIEPQISSSGSKAKVTISVPVPETQLNCDGLKIPIKPLLEKLIADNKTRWEKDLESDIVEIFQQVGI